MHDTTKIGRSLIVFLAALLLVYVVFFDNGVANLSSNNGSSSMILQTPSNTDAILLATDPTYDDRISIENSANYQSTYTQVDGKNFYSTQQLFGNDNTENEALNSNQDTDTLGKVVFDQTHERKGTMGLLNTLKLQDDAQYILKDNLNTHYVYLGFWNDDVSELVTFLGGTHVDISDQFTIYDNHEFGVRVQRIVLPSYKNNLKDITIFSLSTGESRLVQMDNNVENKISMKLEIKNRFSKFYSI